MKNSLICICWYLLILAIFSCETKKKDNTDKIPASDEVEGNTKSSALTFEEVEVNSFPDAIIEMYSPLGEEFFKEGAVPFEFNIKNYPLNDGPRNFILRLCINGDQPVSYHMPIFKREFNRGTYRAVAFLIDQEGIALKEFGNYVQRDFIVGDSQAFPESDEPFMVLNLPQEEQVYVQGEPVIVDFLLVGGGLQENGLKFILSVNGQDQDILEPIPVQVSNLPEGVHEISVKLVRASGEELSGIFTSARRRIIVEN